MVHVEGCESETTSLNLLLFAAIILRVKGRIESKTGSINNSKRVILSSVFGFDGGLGDGDNAAEVLKKSEARRRVLYCIVDDVDVVVVLGMGTRLTGGRLLRCIEVVMGTRLTGGRLLCCIEVEEGVGLTGGRLFRCEFEDVAVRIVGIY